MTMKTGLAGRRALVTAASKGLGLAAARALAAEGCRVAISSSDDERIQNVAEALRRDGADVVARAADLRSAEACSKLLAWAVRSPGGLDGPVHHPPRPVPGTGGEPDDKSWLGAGGLVLMSAVRLSRA